MNDLIKYGWIKRDLSDIKYKKEFLTISILMRTFKSQEIENFQYVLIDKYFIKENNLYFIGNNEIYSIDLNINFNQDIYKEPLVEYKKIKLISKYSINNILKYELISNQLKRDIRLNKILKSNI
jgi:hypothetical protein